jgi:hypothetical protein
VEEHLVASLGEHQLDRVVDVAQDADDLAKRPRRDDDARLGHGIERGDGLDRDAVVVRRCERDPVALESRQDAGEDGSRLIAGRGEDRLPSAAEDPG